MLQKVTERMESMLDRRGFIGKVAAGVAAIGASLFGTSFVKTVSACVGCNCCELCYPASQDCAGAICTWEWTCCSSPCGDDMTQWRWSCTECWQDIEAPGACTGLRSACPYVWRSMASAMGTC
jgi:hypothetical protein